jgi:hypothetical protein
MAGFVLGFSIGIIIDQSHKLFGVAPPSGSYMEELWGTLQALPDTSGTTLLVGAGSLALLLALRSMAPKWPRALLVMVLAILASSLLDLADHGVAVTGDVPTGLFSVGIPDVSANDLGPLLAGALAVVFVGYSGSLAAARAMAVKHGYEIDANQELIAQGMSNGAAGLVGGFPVDGSLSKSSVADTAGQQTQMASLINAGFVLLTLLFLASIFEQLPSATLGAVVIDAMLRADHPRPDAALPPRQPVRLRVLPRRDGRHPVLRDHRRHPDRRRALAAAADRPLLADVRPPARPQALLRRLPRPRRSGRLGDHARHRRRPHRRAVVLRRRRPLPRPRP